ncbi:unnamed protein product [Dibothriocephalus latus]|uniref:Uncharacterized protein n=1 Tax=Dibothriocephalus latus TaxID=60516 RepID=A0A3P7N9H1_DIBLA|nr:unnamed protein product [Dibothriocephalus latus]
MGAQETIDVPISFAPTELREYDVLCCVQVRKVNPEAGRIWPHGMTEIEWVTPIKRLDSGVHRHTAVKVLRNCAVSCFEAQFLV